MDTFTQPEQALPVKLGLPTHMDIGSPEPPPHQPRVLVDRLIADGPRIQEWMHARSGLPKMADFHGIAREVDGRIVAAFGYDHFQDRTCCLHLCVDSPSAINRSLLSRAFSVPFNQWGYTCLLCMIQPSNVKSLNMAKRLGFTEVGMVPGVMYFGVMNRKDCRWLWLAERPK